MEWKGEDGRVSESFIDSCCNKCSFNGKWKVLHVQSIITSHNGSFAVMICGGGGGCFSCDRIFHRDDRKTLSDRVKVPRCFDFLKSGFRLCR